MPYSMSKQSRWGYVIAAIAFVLMLWIISAFMTGRLPFKFFDSQRWKQVERSDDYSRLRMIESLTLSGRLNRITRAEVVSLLGPSDDTNYFNEWDFVYWLGPERSFISLDSEWLVIKIGSTGRVVDYRIVSD